MILDMKISHATVLITFLFYIDAAFTQTIEIKRFLPDGKLKNWKDGIDSFTIPYSVCNDQNSGYGDYCNTSCALIEQAGNKVYSCDCSDKEATVTYLNNTWRCLGNREARTLLGCEVNPTLFTSENMDKKLRTLNTAWRRKTILNDLQASCDVNITTSWYIGCSGEKIPLGKYSNRTKEIFLLKWISSVNKPAYFVKVQNVESVDIFKGRVINLGISCLKSQIQEGCLLFRLDGSFTCPAEIPTVPSQPSPSSSIAPTASSMSLRKTASRSPSSTTLLKTTAGSVKASRTQAVTDPNSAGKQRTDDESSSSPLGIIAGVTASVALVLLLLGALFIYRRRKSRKDAHTSTPGHTKKMTGTRNAKTNSAFELEKQNDYVTGEDKKKSPAIHAPDQNIPDYRILYGTLLNPDNSQSDGLYAALDVQEGHNIYGHRECAEQPVYSVPEDLPVKDSKETSKNGPHEPEPVYNVLEDQYAEVSEEPAWYGSTPVDDPLYNTLEDPNQYTGSEPVYNVLEGPEQSGAGEDDSYGPSGLQDPVYNVLEGPNPGSSENGLYSDSSEREDTVNTNIPVYAVVDKTKKTKR